MKSLASLLPLSLLVCSSVLAVPFTPGNIVVLREEGNATVGNAGSLVEFNSSGTIVQAIALPFDSTTNAATSIVFSGVTSAFGHATTLSADGAKAVIIGYGNTFTTVDSSTPANSPRVVATVKYDGTYARPFSSSTFNSGVVRSGTSDGFSDFWGNGNTAATYLNSATTVEATACRVVSTYNGNLFSSVAGVVRQYSGLPTTGAGSSAALTLNLDGGAAASGAGYGFPTNIVAGAHAYVGNVSANAAAGIQRFDFDGSSWIYQYTIVLPNSDKPQHLAVDYSGSVPVIYVIHGVSSGTANRMYKVTDNGPAAANATIANFATAPTGTSFRGVVMAPTQPPPPSFTVHPVDTTNNYGATATFGPVSADRANPGGYTWKKGGATLSDGPSGTGSTISGAATATLSISGITAGDAGTYRAVASNNGGSVTSNPALLVLAGSSITTQLVSRTNAAGTTASFFVVSAGAPPLSYAWTHDNNPIGDGPSGFGGTISGSTTSNLVISGVQDGDAGSYSVTVTDGTAAQSVSTATLTVVDPPQIAVHPVDQGKVVGQTANFFVTAIGGALSHQWYKGAVPLTNGPTGTGATYSGVQSSNLTIANVQLGDAGSYTVTVTNLAGSATSNPGNLTVGQPPIVGALTDVIALPGSDAVFSASVSGTGPFTYTWRHNGTVLFNDFSHIFGADTATLGITNVDIPDRRLYALSVSNAYGGVTVSANLFVIIDTNQPNDVPNLLVYEPFNYPISTIPATGFHSWENLIAIYNRVTGQPAYWINTGGGLFTAILANDLIQYTGVTRQPPGLYPWPGIDGSGDREWTWSSGGANNHLRFGGVTNGSAYFSFIMHGDQGGPSDNGTADVIAGFTSGNSTTAGANADTYVYKLCTLADTTGGDGYRLGVFKGGGLAIASSSVNGQWATPHLLRGQIHFIVGSYKINSGGTSTNDDVVSLWIDPPRSSFGAAESNLPPPDAGGMLTNWNNNAAITEFGVRASLNTSPFSKRMADLRIGKTWASVTGPYYPRLKMTPGSPDVTISWPAKDSVGGFGYKLQTSTNVIGPYILDANTPTQVGTNNVVTETPGAPQFWILHYPPRSGAVGQY
jgi:hypothetical protein